MNYNIDEVLFEGEEIGYTDFVKIYLNKKITGEQLDTLRLHECSHIWLRHNIRRRKIENVNHQLWNIACDMEIAYHMYDQENEDTIIAPRSRLKGGIIKKHCNEHAGCIYAEDFYFSLLKKEENNMTCWDDMKENDHDNIDINEEIEIENCIKIAKEEKNKQLIQSSTTKQQHIIELFTAPKPSLASEIDSVRRSRSLLIRKDTYARPARRDDPYFFKRGKISKLKSAKITIYVDRSGSFNSEKTKNANEKIISLIKKYRGSIQLDCLYFNDKIMLNDPGHGLGGTNYATVINHINCSSSALNIILTDDDYCDTNISTKEKIAIVPIGCNITNISKILNLKELS